MTESANPPDPDLPPSNARFSAESADHSWLSLGAVAAAVGAVLVLIGYPMVWMIAELDPRAKVTGFGRITNSDSFVIVLEQSYSHWVAGVAMLVLIGFAIARLLGKRGESWRFLPVACAVVAVASTCSSYLSLADGFLAGPGLYLALFGSVLAFGGAVAMSLGK